VVQVIAVVLVAGAVPPATIVLLGVCAVAWQVDAVIHWLL
jgi:hypothetical protein